MSARNDFVQDMEGAAMMIGENNANLPIVRNNNT